MDNFSLHSALNELPFLLAGMGSVLLLFSIVAGGTNAKKVAMLILALAALLALATYVSGRSVETVLSAVPGVPKDQIERHHDAARTSFSATLLLGFVAIDGLIMLKRNRPWSRAFMVIALIISAGAAAANGWAVVEGSALRESILQQEFPPHDRPDKKAHPQPYHEPPPRKNAVPLTESAGPGEYAELGLIVPSAVAIVPDRVLVRVDRVVAPSPPVYVDEGAVAVFEIAVQRKDERVQTIRLSGEPPWSAAALTALLSWRYSLPGNADDGRLSITFLLRPRALWTARDILKDPPQPSSSTYSAPLPLKLLDPGFPHNRVGSGCVILELGIDAEGNVIDSRILLDEPHFGDFLEQEAKKWKFSPARDQGKAVEGKAVVAVSFVTPY